MFDENFGGCVWCLCVSVTLDLTHFGLVKSQRIWRDIRNPNLSTADGLCSLL